MDTFINRSDFTTSGPHDSSSPTCSTTRRAASDEEIYTTVASTGPKRRAGRTKFRETRHPVYKGVRRRNSGKWVCEVREPNKKSRIWLGTFPTPEMAARAHDVAAIALRGRSACLNFADSAWLLPVPASTNARDIQKAAAEAAEAFRPPSHSEAVTGSSDYARPENVTVPPEVDVFYMDEEAGTPGLIANMAEGLLLSPPPYEGSGSQWDDDMEDDADVSLWSYSI
ncbi:dehydration-responsive element-binding protein 1B-like [Magnolia sinica]|uniref:dehydration-responsive element-binding protein 1B-like n=1 Tax=Magnolia sinica TaxID=86752 RepID=UPI00265AC044|nr:dehydration-responsive element-binding protein 1B-like [Magnolia sinica]